MRKFILLALGIPLLVMLVACTSESSEEVSDTPAPTETAAGQALSEVAAMATAKIATQAAEIPTPAAEPPPVTDSVGLELTATTEPVTTTGVLSETISPDSSMPITQTDSFGFSFTPDNEVTTPDSELSLSGDGSAVNDIPIEQIVVMSDEVQEHVREIYHQGQLLGRNANAFSKLGDSLIATPSFFTLFDTHPYNLGPYEYLQPAIEYYAGSFERYGVALRPGLHAWGVFDPLWANKDWCQANETMIDCEFRLHNPGILLILLGTNDSGSPGNFAHNIRKVVQHSIDNGVIPVLVTKADRFEGPENTNNNLLREIAAEYNVPLWDFDLVAETIPNRGLQDDDVHLTVFVENDFTMPQAYQTGHGIHNITGLMMLEAIRQATIEE